jgi:hypothetical protein
MKNTGFLAFCTIVLATFYAPLGRADLITNGNFGTGDFTGWTASSSGDPYYTTVTNLAPTSDSTYAAEIGAYYDDSGNMVQGSISQTLNTVAGQQYTITFLYGEYDGNPSLSSNNPYNSLDPDNPADCSQNGCYLDSGNVTSSNDPSANPYAQNNNLNVSFGGSSVGDTSNFFTSATYNAATNPDSGESIGDYFYEEGTAVVNATGTSTLLEFDANDIQQNVVLTDISVEATPEPGTISLLGLALAGLGLLARRRSTAGRMRASV